MVVLVNPSFTDYESVDSRRVNITDERFGDLGELEVYLVADSEEITILLFPGAASIYIPLTWSGPLPSLFLCQAFNIGIQYQSMLKRKIYKYYNQMLYRYEP